MRATAIALALGSILLFAGCSSGGSAASAGSDPATIVQQQCVRCHPIDRIKSAQHDAAGWQATIARMRGKGAQIDDAQAAALATFLAGGGASRL